MTDRLNRALWTVLGLALLALGVLGALASRGDLGGSADPTSQLLWPELVADWNDAGAAAPLAVAGAGALAMSLGVALMRAQLPRRRPTPADLRLDTRGQVGVTTVRGGALPGVLAADLRRMPAVRDAKVTLEGPPEATRVAARLDVIHGTTVPRVSIQFERCLARFAATTGVKISEVEITLRPAELPPVSRVS